ncbi:MAG: T9SS type A sorting domain-containing protein [Flavobacteriales bacterium]
MGDTVIDGLTTQTIAMDGHYYSQDPPGYHDYEGVDIHTKLDDGVLYTYQPDVALWDTLIWYSATPGDQWQVLQPSDFYCGCMYSVTDTGHTEVEGMSLRYVQTTVIGDECESVTRRFLERIGSVYGTFLVECQDGEIDTTLRCYQDVDMNYSPANAPECDFISAVDELPTRQAVNIYPNPGMDQFTLELPAFAFADQMELYDAWGKKVLVVGLMRERTQVDVSILPRGLYAYRMVDKAKGTVANGTWLKQ